MKTIQKNEKNRINELAPCGVFCGACPSFNKSCKGCGSEDKKQKRKSKFNCKIRTCCNNEKRLDFCIDCEQYPCKTINKKLLDTNQGNSKFTYRHETPDIFAKLKTMSLDEYFEFQKQRWKCKSCGGTVHFYHYRCDTCEREQMIK